MQSNLKKAFDKVKVELNNTAKGGETKKILDQIKFGMVTEKSMELLATGVRKAVEIIKPQIAEEQGDPKIDDETFFRRNMMIIDEMNKIKTDTQRLIEDSLAKQEEAFKKIEQFSGQMDTIKEQVQNRPLIEAAPIQEAQREEQPSVEQSDSN